MPKTKNGLAAFAVSIFSTLFTGLAFVTSGWLVSDGKQENPQFMNIGLWVACFKNYEEPRHWYDKKFHSCWLVFQKEYYVISDIIFKSFFIATQFWFTASVVATLIAVWYTLLYMHHSRKSDRFVRVLYKTGTFYTAAAVCGTVALIVFGVNGRGRDWMPDWEHNRIGYSYGLAVTGVVGNYICGLLFVIEGRARAIQRRRMKPRRSENNDIFELDDFDMSLTVSEV